MRLIRLILVLSVVAIAAPARAGGAPPALAVLYFDNDTGDAAYEHLGKGLADMMVTHLASVPTIRVVERDKLEALLKELKLQRTRYFDPRTAQKIGRGIGAEYAVTGAFLSVEPNIRIDVRLIRIATGEVVKAHMVVGRKERFFELLQRLAAALIEGLGPALAGDTRKLAEAQEANRVDDLDAAVEYGEGLDKRDNGDLRGASEHMQKVVARAPRFALAKARQMEILKALYAAKDTRAKELRSSEDTLLARVEQHLADLERRGEHDDDHFAFRMLRGDLLLRRLALAAKQPGADLRKPLDAYLDNQERYLDEAIRRAKKDPTVYDGRLTCIKCISIDDDTNRLIRELELHHPMVSSTTSPHEIAIELSEVVMFGVTPRDNLGPRVKIDPPVCFYKLGPRYAKASVAALERAQAAVDAHAAADKDAAGGWREGRTIEIAFAQATVYLAMAKPEDAVTPLQSIITRYPKSRHFATTEAFLRAILAGSEKMPDGTPLVPPCVDPR